jgi:hypothetical protein
MNENDGLRGFEFEHYFSKLLIVKNIFEGVFSINTVPKRIKKKHFLICNLSPSNEPGSHWIVILRADKNHIEIFNSLGYDTQQKFCLFRNKLPFKTIKFFEYNENQFQPDAAKTCGLFCIYFAINRILNYDHSFSTILEDIFVENKDENDKKVIYYCERLLNSKNETFF